MSVEGLFVKEVTVKALSSIGDGDMVKTYVLGRIDHQTHEVVTNITYYSSDDKSKHWVDITVDNMKVKRYYNIERVIFNGL